MRWRNRLAGHCGEQGFVLIDDVLPIVKFSHPLLSAMPERLHQRAVSYNPLKFLYQILFICIRNAGVAYCLYVFGSSEG